MYTLLKSCDGKIKKNNYCLSLIAKITYIFAYIQINEKTPKLLMIMIGYRSTYNQLLNVYEHNPDNNNPKIFTHKIIITYNLYCF